MAYPLDGMRLELQKLRRQKGVTHGMYLINNNKAAQTKCCACA